MELTEGIVIKTVDYKEKDKIIYLITASGKVSLILKGAKNPKSGTFMYSHELSKIEFDLKKNYLTAGRLLDSYPNIKLDYDKYSSVLMITEISDVLIEHINDYKVFYSFLSDILDLINNGKNHLLLNIIFRLKILYLLGVAPVFNRCVDCDTRENLVGFSFYGGGMKCSEHIGRDDYLYDSQVINILRVLYNTKLNEINLDLDVDFNALDTFLTRYYEYYLGFTSKVKKVLGFVEK